jgi:ketosteroid isomerase-like protein
MPAGDAQIVREVYERFNRGDYEGSTAILHEGAVLHQWRDVPDSDTYVGREGFARGVGRWISEFEPGFRFELEETREEDARVWLRVRITARGRESGVELEQLIFHVWEVRDGKAAECWVFSDLDESLACARAAP